MSLGYLCVVWVLAVLHHQLLVQSLQHFSSASLLPGRFPMDTTQSALDRLARTKLAAGWITSCYHVVFIFIGYRQPDQTTADTDSQTNRQALELAGLRPANVRVKMLFFFLLMWTLLPPSSKSSGSEMKDGCVLNYIRRPTLIYDYNFSRRISHSYTCHNFFPTVLYFGSIEN